MLKISDVEPLTALNGLFTNRKVSSGLPSTRLVAEWFNAVQSELINVVEGAGIVLNPQDDSQLIKAINAKLTALLPKRSYGLNDFIRIPDVPGGLIIQWGTTPGSDVNGLTKATLPIAFPSNNGLVCIANYYSGARTAIFTQVVSITQTEVSFFCSGQQGGPAQYAPVRYIVVGY